MICIIDYGVGNLFSLKSSLAHLGLEAKVSADAADIRAADRIILPGVGAFGDAMAKLEATGLVPVIREEAAKKPLLGICLGMQLLFEKSCEYGEHDGLGFVPGQVCPLAPDLGDKSLKVPQIGWNAVHILRDDPLFKYVRDGEYFYYVHSYYGKNCAANTLAVSDYSLPVTGVVKAGKVYGTQFHPEKSGDAGLRLLGRSVNCKNNLSVSLRSTRPGCGSQHLRRFACILLAAAPTALPCFRYWRRSLLLPLSRGASGEEAKRHEMPKPLLLGEVAAPKVQTERLYEGKP